MKKVILHIGRHKSGTTALQDYLNGNMKWLYTNGYEYLSIYRRETAQHLLSEPFARNQLKDKTDEEVNLMIKEAREKILESSNNDLTLLISSEAFQNCDPKIIRRIFTKDLFDVKVVCYFRDQVSYLISSYAQAVHAGFRTDNFDTYLNVFNANYWSFSEQWDDQFNNMHIGIFAKESLKNGDIVEDFCTNILDIKSNIHERYSSNPSLSRRYLAFKLLYNKKYHKNELEKVFNPGKLYVLLGEFSKNDKFGKLKLTNEQRNFIMEKYKVSNHKFFAKYLPGSEFNYQKADDLQVQYIMDEEEFDFIFEKIDKHEWPIKDGH